MLKQLLEKTVRVSLLILLLPMAIVAQGTVGGAAARESNGRLRLVVTGGDESKPVKGADVLVRWQTGDRVLHETTKTNSQGVANISSVRHGTIVIQITALGWKTAGRQQDFRDESPIVIHLEQEQRPEPTERPTPRNRSWMRFRPGEKMLLLRNGDQDC
jgi:hypothetical protein